MAFRYVQVVKVVEKVTCDDFLNLTRGYVHVLHISYWTL